MTPTAHRTLSPSQQPTNDLDVTTLRCGRAAAAAAAAPTDQSCLLPPHCPTALLPPFTHILSTQIHLYQLHQNKPPTSTTPNNNTNSCLEEAIANFAGSTLVISHDRWFLDRVATHILAFGGDSTATWFEGGWGEYEAFVRQRDGGQLVPHRVKFRRLATV